MSADLDLKLRMIISFLLDYGGTTVSLPGSRQG